MAKSAKTVRTRKAAARRLGVTPPALGEWAKAEWFPKNGHTSAGWNVAVIRRARDANFKKGSAESSKSQELTVALKAAKLKRENIRADHEQREEDEHRGNVLPCGELYPHAQ